MKPLLTSWKQRKVTSRAAVSTPQKAQTSQIKARQRKNATSTPCHAAPLDSGLSPIMHTSSSKAAASDEEEGDPLDLGCWGLPAEVVAGYAHRGVRCMFPWQLECLRTGKVLAGAGNLVYSAPTSAGKTLVAEILMLKRILETKTKALLVLPFVSLAREKELALAELFGGCGVRVGGFLGQKRPPGGLSAVDLAVCTIERANSLLNGMLLDQGTLGELGILVVDELHLVGDPHRGYLLELMLTKVAYAQKRGLVGPRGVQVVAMSATLANLAALALWLDADLYQTDFRPVPLRQLFKLGRALCEGPNLRPVRQLPATSGADDPEGLLALCLESWAEGHALLVFCPTRRWCEALAASLARCVRQLVTAAASGSGEPCGDLVERLRARTSAEVGQSLVQRLRSTPGAMDPALASCLSVQVAFHHAGLTMEERDLLEGAFREGAVRALVATTTLSSGVNLPARRVIIRSANFQGHPIDSLSYHQMVGRAGRMGLDTQGEGILMCRESDRALAQRLSRAEAQPITSCLTGSSTSLRRALLEVVASGVASSPEELSLYTQCTLRHHLCTGAGGEEDLSGALQFLVEHQLVHLQAGEDGGGRRYRPSQLGRAVLASGLSPDDALAMVGEIERARRCLALDTDLHLVYLVTPAHLGAQLGALDWGRYQELWERLSAAKRRVAGLVGVDEACVARAAAGRTPQPGRILDGCRRFYLALALERLASERPLAEVAHAFSLPRGLLQSLQQGAATFAGMVCVLCQRLGWRHLQLLVAEFQARLHFGVQPELCPLLALPSLDGPLARLVFDAGFADPAALAQVEPSELDITLRNAGPFQGRGESRCWHLPAHGMVTTTQLADILVREARAVVEGSLGAAHVAWGDRVAARSTAVSPQKTQADISEDSSRLQKSKKPNDDKGSQIVNSANVVADTEGPNPSARPYLNGILSTQRAVISPKPLKTATSPHALPGKQRGPASSKSPKEAASEGSENSNKHEKGTQGMPVSLSLPWPSLPPGGTVAHIEAETHDSDDEERLTLDGILGSLPIPPEKSPKEAHRKSISSPVVPKDASNGNLEDAISQWDANGSPLTLSRAKETGKQDRTPSDTNSTGGDSPMEMFYRLSGSFAVESEGSKIGKENMSSSRKAHTPGKRGGRHLRARNSGVKNSVQKPSCTTLKVSPPFVVSSNDRVLRSQARDSCANGKEAFPNAVSPQVVVEIGNSFDFASSCSFFPDTVVPRASKGRKSPPLTLLRSRRPSTACKSTGQAIAASPPLPPKRDSYRFSGSFVLDSQTLKAMDGITCRTGGIAETAASSLAGDANCGNVPNSVLVKNVTPPQKSPSPIIGAVDISSAACSLGSSTLSELFSSPGNNDVPKSAASSPTSKRSSSGSSGSPNKILKRSTSDGELFSSTEDSDLSLDSLADRVREGFTWKKMECAEDFIRDWEKWRHFSLSVAARVHMETEPSIGLRRSTRLVAKLRDSPPIVADGKCLVGIAVCWEDYKAHFLSLESAAPRLLELLSRRLAAAKRVVVPDVSQTLRFLARPCGLDPARLGWEEPRMAHWLLDPSRAEDSLADMVAEWAPHLEPLLEGLSGMGSSAEEASARLAVLVLHLQKPLTLALKKAGMYAMYREHEVRFHGVLCKMDLNGFGYDPGRAQQTVAESERALHSLQTDAWSLAGQRFALYSAKEVDAVVKARVVPLAKEGSLPPGSLSSRATLTHLSTLHPLPAKVNDWRKLHAVVIKNLRPLGQHQRRLQQSDGLSRIRPWSQPWTATGRVMVTGPNLQGIAKNFTVCTQPPVSITARAAFRPSPGAVLMSADYSQLELRLLAHLSRDEKLCEVFRAGGDVFRRMAALWSHCHEDDVDASLRQRTKQICYGITYGQGAHSLAQQLGVKRGEADTMINQFRRAFPGLQRYATQLVERARVTGEVRTLLGRRRPLTNLRSVHDADRAKAERQALSTVVQGSAADLLRQALVTLDKALAQHFSGCQGLLPENDGPKGGAFMVLQLHDELLLEVCQHDLHAVSVVVRECMEGAGQLSVPLAVRIRAGPSWADLNELRLD